MIGKDGNNKRVKSKNKKLIQFEEKEKKRMEKFSRKKSWHFIADVEPGFSLIGVIIHFRFREKWSSKN